MHVLPHTMVRCTGLGASVAHWFYVSPLGGRYGDKDWVPEGVTLLDHSNKKEAAKDDKKHHKVLRGSCTCCKLVSAPLPLIHSHLLCWLASRRALQD